MSMLLFVCDDIATLSPKNSADTITHKKSLLEFVPHSIDIEQISQQQNNTPELTTSTDLNTSTTNNNKILAEEIALEKRTITQSTILLNTEMQIPEPQQQLQNTNLTIQQNTSPEKQQRRNRITVEILNDEQPHQENIGEKRKRDQIFETETPQNNTIINTSNNTSSINKTMNTSYPIQSVERRNKKECKITKDSFFSCSPRSSFTRLLSEGKIDVTRQGDHNDELESFEIDEYIKHLNKSNEEQKTIIFSVYFFVSALRHLVDRDGPDVNDTEEIGNSTERLPLNLPYSIEDETRWKTFDTTSLGEVDFKNISKVHIFKLTQIMLTKTHH